MNPESLFFLEPNIDLTKVNSLPQKRLLAFVNYFLTQTVTFLNRFSYVCEEKLENISIKTTRLETLLLILEGKLASIPSLDDMVATNSQPIDNKPLLNLPNSEQITNGVDDHEEETNSENKMKDIVIVSFDSVDINANKSETNINENILKNKDCPLYKKYFTMINLGIPVAAVKQKMSMEGIDQTILDNPNSRAEHYSESLSNVDKLKIPTEESGDGINKDDDDDKDSIKSISTASSYSD